MRGVITSDEPLLRKDSGGMGKTKMARLPHLYAFILVREAISLHSSFIKTISLKDSILQGLAAHQGSS